MSPLYIDYSNNHFGSLFNEREDHLFKLISASLTIIDNTQIYDQSSIINAFISTADISDSEFTNLTLTETSMQAVVSQLTLENVTIDRVEDSSSLGEQDFILTSLDSTLVMKNIGYSNSD